MRGKPRIDQAREHPMERAVRVLLHVEWYAVGHGALDERRGASARQCEHG